MLDWKNVTEEEERLSTVMELIFCNYPKLLDFLFEPSIPRLKDEPEKLLAEANVFSSGEKILIQVALDLWNGSGKSLFWDIIHRLDHENQKRILLSLQYLRIIPSVGAHCLSTIKIGAFKDSKKESALEGMMN